MLYAQLSTPLERPAVADDAYAAAAWKLFQTSLRSGERIRLPVVGFSMAPLLRPGDAVWIEQVDPATLQRGAIVVVYRDGGLLTHRLVAVDGQGWHTKGDNNRLVDSPVAAAAIQGRIVAIERGSRFIDIQRRAWPIVSRLLGLLGRLETRIVHAHPRWQLLTFIESLLFRIVVRALVALALRCTTG